MISITSENFEEEVKKSDIPVIMDIWASWCGPCQALAPIFEELSIEYEGKMKFVKLSTEEDKDLPGKLNVMGIPTLIVFKGGEEVERLVGNQPKEAIKEKIDKALE